MPGSRVTVTVSPQPYELIELTIEHSVLFQGSTTFSLTTTPINAPIKTYTAGLVPMHTIFSFGILHISQQSFRLMKGNIAHTMDLLEANLLLYYTIHPLHSHQNL